MVVKSIIFEYNRRHKVKWVSPVGESENEIDHVFIDSRHHQNLIDVRTYKGTKIDSDHYLIVAKLSWEANYTKETWKNFIPKVK